jgi:FHS family L-fucose permease-like MFS transporter
VGALLAWPCLVYRSFGGFCAATFVIGNGLGSLETAANPYLGEFKTLVGVEVG